MPWPSSAVNSGPRRFSQAHGITETRRNSQPTCSTAFCSSPVGRPDLQSPAQPLREVGGGGGERALFDGAVAITQRELAIEQRVAPVRLRTRHQEVVGEQAFRMGRGK